MQTAAQAASSALSTRLKPQSPNATDNANPSKPSQLLLDNFWRKMTGLFGNTWVSSYGASPSGVGAETWASALVGLAPMQIARGLQETLVLGSDFPPSAPRFRALCLQIPNLAIVRDSVRSGKRDPFTFLVLSKLDHFLYRRADERVSAEMVREAYEVARDHVMRGGALPDTPVAVLAAPPAPKRERCAPEKAKGFVDEINSVLGIGDEDHAADESPERS